MRVLLIEDDARLAEALSEQLRAAGFAVDRSADGVEGLYLGEEFPIDLAIIDLGLPELPGLEVIRRLRSRGRDFPILVLTARSGWEDKVAGLAHGGEGLQQQAIVGVIEVGVLTDMASPAARARLPAK